MNRSVEELEMDFDSLINPLPSEFISAGLEKVEKEIKIVLRTPSLTYRINNKVSGRCLKIQLSESGIYGVWIEDKKIGMWYSLREYLKYRKRPMEVRAIFKLGEDTPRYVDHLRHLISGELGKILDGSLTLPAPRDYDDYR